MCANGTPDQTVAWARGGVRGSYSPAAETLTGLSGAGMLESLHKRQNNELERRSRGE
jgi:hypothetical protein